MNHYSKVFALESDVNVPEEGRETYPPMDVYEISYDDKSFLSHSKDLDKQNDSIDEIIVDSQELSSYEDKIGSSELTTVSAEMMSILLKRLERKYNIKSSACRASLSKENFTMEKRSNSNRLALEGVGEVVSKMWNTISKAVSSLMFNFKNAWNKFIGSVIGSINTVKKTIELINKTEGEQSLTDPIKSSQTFNKEFVGYELITPDVIKSFIGRQSEATNIAINFGKGVSEEVKDYPAFIKAMLKQSIKVKLGKNMFNYTKGGFIEFGSDQAPLIGGVYFNYEVMVVSWTDKGKLDSDALLVRNGGRIDSEVSDVKIQLGTRAELLDICNSLLDNLTVCKTSDRVIKDQIKAFSELHKTLDSIINNKELNKETGLSIQQTEDAKARLKDLLSVYNLVMKEIVRINNTIAKTNVICNSVSIDYVTKSLKTFSNLVEQ